MHSFGDFEVGIQICRLVCVEFDFGIVHDGGRVENARHYCVQILHGAPYRTKYLGRADQRDIAGTATLLRRFEVIEVVVECVFLASGTQSEVSYSLHDWLAASQKGSLKSKVLGIYLPACKRRCETHCLKDGEVHQSIVVTSFGRVCMAVERIPAVTSCRDVALLDNMGITAVGAEGPDLFREIEFGVIIVVHDWIMLNSGLDSESDIHDVVYKRYVH